MRATVAANNAGKAIRSYVGEDRVAQARAAMDNLKAQAQTKFADHWAPHGMYIEDNYPQVAKEHIQPILEKYFFEPARASIPQQAPVDMGEIDVDPEDVSPPPSIVKKKTDEK